jgi:hypothetical protein
MKGKWSREVKFTAIALTSGVLTIGSTLGYSAQTELNEARLNGRTVVNSPEVIPTGTILPVTLLQNLSVEHAQAGQEIEVRVKQDVPLSKQEKIPVNSRVIGKIVSVVKATDGNGVDVSMRFEKIEHRKELIPIAVSLRAMASYQAVRIAQTPFTGADGGTPPGWANTTQIGGDIRYGDGGEVRNLHKQPVGKGVVGGVLVHVREQPGTACDGPENGDDRVQALWVFSADACGVYAMRGVQIAQTGKKDPIGVITLRFEKAEMEIAADDAMLLRVVSTK